MERIFSFKTCCLWISQYNCGEQLWVYQCRGLSPVLWVFIG